ncbi:hypothetical protein H7X69_00820 [Candidatus Saccharibacteria bacterium]|nr:hypothetical protein [Candidatus Saccharibacteria bacterium]
MIKTYATSEQTLDSIEYRAPSSWMEASKVVRGFSTEQTFLQTLANEDLQPSDRTTVEYANALSAYAEDYCDVNNQDGAIEQSQVDQIKLLANAPRFMHNKEEVTYYDNERRKRRLTDEEWNHYQSFKPYMVWYNQLLSDYAYTNPQAKLSDMNRALVEQSIPSFPGQTEVVERGIKDATRGARTEAVSRQLLDRTPVDYSPGTIEDDLRGGDLIVMHNGHRIKVDIKSSLSDVAAIRGGYDKIYKEHISYAISKKKRDHNVKDQHVVVVFPGFTDLDLGDSFNLRLPEEDIQNRADFLAHQLKFAFRELRL